MAVRCSDADEQGLDKTSEDGQLPLSLSPPANINQEMAVQHHKHPGPSEDTQ